MSSLRNRELGATLRHSVITGQPATVTIDHREYRIMTEQISGEPRKERYGVWPEGDVVTGYAMHETWASAKGHWDSVGYSGFRIYDFSSTPPTDVTDADPDAAPEMVWMAMRWEIRKWFGAWRSFDISESTTATWSGGELVYANAVRQFPVGYTPTIHDLNNALKPYNISVSVPEEPQWHIWDRRGDGKWEKDVADDYPRFGAAVTPYYCRVWGTVADRREKRDLLLEAAEKAGKGS